MTATMTSSEIRTLAARILIRVGFFDMLRSIDEPRSDEGSDSSVLPWDDPDLQSLRKAYCDMASDSTGHSQWKPPYAISEIDPQQFRRDSAFMWQHRDANVPLSYLATYFFLRASNDADLLAQCKEDSAFGAYALYVQDECITRDRLDSVAQLGFLRRSLGLSAESTTAFLDIGSGYGRLAWRLHQCFPLTRTLCVDAIPESTFLCDLYLRHRNVSGPSRVVELPRLEQELSATPIDVALAVNSLTECSTRTVVWWLDTVARWNIPWFMIVPDAGKDDGLSLYSREDNWRNKVPIEPLLLERGYCRAVLEPKYSDPLLQSYGVSPTHYHLFRKLSS